MTVDQLVNIVAALPQAKSIGDKAYWQTVIPDVVQQVIDEIAQSYDWDWAIGIDSSTTTVSGTGEYTLTGENNDLRDIITILYDSTNVLQKMRPVDAFDLLDVNQTLGEVAVWYQSGVDSSGFPKVTLIDTPDETVTLKVYYRKRNVPITAIPNDFGFVVAHGVLSWINPDFRAMFERSLKKMERRHHVGGKDTNIAQMDPHAVLDNNAITDLHGAG